jgi:MFS transporter, FSR family, fosmidomycin resistance protein
MRKLMLPMAVVVFTRSMIVATLTTFLPTFLTTQGSTLWVAGVSLTILEISAMVGTLFVGSLSDRFGRRRMLVISFCVTPVLMYFFVNSEGLAQIPLLILLGLTAISVVPVLMAIVLENSTRKSVLCQWDLYGDEFCSHIYCCVFGGVPV